MTIGSMTTSGSNKVDNQATDGLTGTPNSLAYRVHEIERHFHGYERWFAKATAPSGTANVADTITSGTAAFQLDAGNDDWGNWIQLIGSSDTPAIASNTHYDPHKILIEAAERNLTYFLQFAFGASGAAGTAAGNWTESILHPLSNQVDSGPIVIQSRRQTVGTNMWGRAKCPGQNTATVDLYVGVHEYEG